MALFPYIDLPALPLPFGQKIDVFGVLSAAGVFLGAWLAAQQARKYSPGDDQPLRDVVPWAVGFGLTGGHFLHLFGYHPELLVEAQRKGDLFGTIFRVWDGLSSMGGVLGALLGIFIFFKKNKLKLFPYLDALALGTAPGWAVARIGCYLVHDHPGLRTDFPLAVNWPGGPRHDLGLYDFFVLAALSVVLWTLKNKRPPQGTLMGILALCYSVSRFLLDTLRETDPNMFVDGRYFGLTPAQYIVIGLGATGVWLLVRAFRGAPKPTVTPPAASASA